MANQLGVTQSCYSKIENGEVDIPYSRIEEIARIFTIQPEDIITFNENIVFNFTNNQNANSNGFVVNNHNHPDSEIKLYEEQHAADKEQIEYLKSIINQLINPK